MHLRSRRFVARGQHHFLASAEICDEPADLLLKRDEVDDAIREIHVAVGASGTDSYQSNKNLLLSNEARVDTKPQLEIFNDDVKCSHGATVGQLEEEELFYLLSRGLNENLARNLLIYGFAEEIINKIEIESIKKQLDEAVLNRLNVSLEA